MSEVRANDVDAAVALIRQAMEKGAHLNRTPQEGITTNGILGRRARATRLRAEERDAADQLPRTKQWHLIMEPAFDWVTGEIDVSPLNPDAPIDPERIIADIVRLTGLPEHTSQDSLPAI